MGIFYTTYTFNGLVLILGSIDVPMWHFTYVTSNGKKVNVYS